MWLHGLAVKLICENQPEDKKLGLNVSIPIAGTVVIVDFKTLKFMMSILLHAHSSFVGSTKAIFD